MTAVGLGRPTVITPIEGLREQANGMDSVIVAAETTGPAVADAVVESLRRGESAIVAARRDRDAIAGSVAGWPAIARETIVAYERPGSGGAAGAPDGAR